MPPIDPGVNATDVEHFTSDFRRPTVIWSWATMHNNGTEHDWHAHAGTLVSGVYFIETPPGRTQCERGNEWIFQRTT